MLQILPKKLFSDSHVSYVPIIILSKLPKIPTGFPNLNVYYFNCKNNDFTVHGSAVTIVSYIL